MGLFRDKCIEASVKAIEARVSKSIGSPHKMGEYMKRDVALTVDTTLELCRAYKVEAGGEERQ